jgi:hypothetical protein
MGCNLSAYTGSKYCSTESFFGEPKALMLVPSTLEIPAASFILKSYWDGLINLGTAVPITEMKDFADNSTETRMHDYANEDQTFLAQGKYRFTASFNKNETQKKALQNLNRANTGIVVLYSNGIRGCTVDSGVTIKAIPLTQFIVEKESLKTMDAPSMIPIRANVKDYKYLNEYDYSKVVTWTDEIDGLTEVDLTVSGTPTATSLTISVLTTINGYTYGITGLAFADFAITGTGTLGVEGGWADVGDGTYTFVTTVLTTGDSVNLVAASVIADVELHVVSSGAVAVTV